MDEIIRGAKAGQGIASGMGDDALSFYTDKQNDQWTGVITNRILDQVNELMPSEGTADYNKLHEWLGKEDGQITFKDLAGPHGQKILDTLLTARSDELREILADAEGMETTAIRSLQSDVSIAEDIQKLEEETVARDNLIAGMEETTTVLSDTVESLAKAKAEVDKTTTDPASTTTTTGGNGDGGGDGDGKTKGSWTDGAKDFKDSVGAFSSGASFILGAAGRQEEAAKVMKIAAMIIMTVAIMERAQAAMDTAGGSFGKFLKHLILPPTPGRYGGVMNSPGYRSFSSGGIAQGPQAGYGAVLHGTEAVVPLGNDRSIPVEMKGSGGNINNTSVTVNMETGSVDTKSDAEQGKQLGQLIQATVTQTISNEQRSGGLLDTGGGG